MNVNLSTPAAVHPARMQPAGPKPPSANEGDSGKLREAFQSFVGQTLFGQLLSAMRKTVGKPAYFHGGRAEEIFQQQLDQVLAEKIAETSGDKLSEPMLELFALGRQ
ncbi:MAG TPA: rod-binding protein [Thermoguttaceae bacterium]|nr:rod-binding protein [Thermoguttaceae bacterium]